MPLQYTKIQTRPLNPLTAAVRPAADRDPPLTFLGGAFSIDMIPSAWRTFSLFIPVVYLISGFRWSFYGTSDVGVAEMGSVSIICTAVLY